MKTFVFLALVAIALATPEHDAIFNALKKAQAGPSIQPKFPWSHGLATRGTTEENVACAAALAAGGAVFSGTECATSGGVLFSDAGYETMTKDEVITAAESFCAAGGCRELLQAEMVKIAEACSNSRDLLDADFTNFQTMMNLPCLQAADGEYCWALMKDMGEMGEPTDESLSAMCMPNKLECFKKIANNFLSAGDAENNVAMISDMMAFYCLKDGDIWCITKFAGMEAKEAEAEAAGTEFDHIAYLCEDQCFTKMQALYRIRPGVFGGMGGDDSGGMSGGGSYGTTGRSGGSMSGGSMSGGGTTGSMSGAESSAESSESSGGMFFGGIPICRRNQAGELCYSKVMNLVQSGEETGAESGESTCSPESGACDTACSTDVQRVVDGSGCCFPVFIEIMSMMANGGGDGSDMGASDGEFTADALMSWITDTCGATNVATEMCVTSTRRVRMTLALPNLSYDYYLANRETLEQAIINDIAANLGVSPDQVTITITRNTGVGRRLLAGDGVTVESVIDPGDDAYADSIEATAATAISTGTFSLGETSVAAGAEGLNDPAMSMEVDETSSQTEVDAVVDDSSAMSQVATFAVVAFAGLLAVIAM